MLGKKSEIYQSWKRAEKALKNVPVNLNVINTGSTAGKKNFDYSYWHVRGYNFGSQPQILYYDFETLKHYAGNISDNAKVFISIEEFKLLVNYYPEDEANYKYYFYLDRKQIYRFSDKKKEILEKAPGLLYIRLLKQEIKSYIKFVLRKFFHDLDKNMEFDRSIENDKKFALAYLKNWSHEFGWDKNHYKLTAVQKMDIKINTERLVNMLRFCHEHGWKPYIVVMPFSPNLRKLLPENILEQCLWKPLNKIQNMGYKVINLYYDEDFADPYLYRNALVFNEMGKRKFNIKIQEETGMKKRTEKQNINTENGKIYCLRNGMEIPWISFGTGVIWKYTRNLYFFSMSVLRQLLSTIKHRKLNRELYGNLHINRVLQEAYDAGYRMFDTGRIYGYSESRIGKIVSGYQDVMVTTKCSAMDITRKYSPNDVKNNLKVSLDNLKRDSADLYMLHWPEGDWLNYYSQIIEEYKKGNIKAFGACNLEISHLEQIKKAGLEYPMVMQTEIHPLNVRADIREYCQDNGIQVMAFAPAAHRNKIICESSVIQELVRKYHKSDVQIILRWHYQHNVIPVVSAFSRKHMDENLDIFDFSLTEKEMHGIDALDKGKIFLDSHGIDDPKYIYNY